MDRDELAVDAAAHRGGVGSGDGPETGEIARNGFIHRRRRLNRRQRAAAHAVTTSTRWALGRLVAPAGAAVFAD